MATKKAPVGSGSSTAVAVKKQNTSVVSIQDALRAQAAAATERTAPPSGNKIKLGSKMFKFPDGSESDTAELVVVDYVTVNTYYEGKYDPKNIVPPNCFAIGAIPKNMVPSSNAPDVQASDCTSCPMNQFGSDGNGKACKNMRRLAVLPPDADESTPIWTLDVPPTSIKSFDGIVQGVARTFQLPPVGVTVSVTFDSTVEYAKLVFSDPKLNDNVAAHFARQAEAQEILQTEPDVSGFTKKAPATRKPVVARR